MSPRLKNPPRRKTEEQNDGTSASQVRDSNEIEKENLAATASLQNFSQAREVLGKIVEALEQGNRQALLAHTVKSSITV